MQLGVDRFPVTVWWHATSKQAMIYIAEGIYAADKLMRRKYKMILADKIINLRKKNGWSQEELAEKMQVSRQAVSKWEIAQTVPELEKILMLSSLFDVTTDYLLKDEIEDEEFSNETAVTTVKRITLAEANEFLKWRKAASIRIALGVLLCIIAAIPLLLLGAATEAPTLQISENTAVAVGLTALLLIVATAVALFISCGFKNAPFEFIDKEPFETEYGVCGMVKERQKAYRSTYAKFNIIGVCLCIISPIPLFIGAFSEKEFLTVVMLTVTMLLAGIGTVFFVVSGVRFASMQKLLKEGEFAPQKKRKDRMKETVATTFWLTATAVYLGWSFLTDAWEITWVVWPIAGILFAIVMCLYNLLTDREK